MKIFSIFVIAVVGVVLSVAYGFIGNRLMQNGRFGFAPRFFEFSFFYLAITLFWLFESPSWLIFIVFASGLIGIVTTYLGDSEKAIAMGYTDPWAVVHTLASFAYVIAIVYGIVRLFAGFV